MTRFDAGDAQLYFEIVGQGSPVVLIVGLGGNHRFWAPLLDLWAKHHACLIFDGRGVGLSSGSAIDEYSTSLLARDVVGLMDHVGFSQAHVLGRSMGGCVAQELAVLAPERITSLTLASSWARADGMLKAILSSWTRLLSDGDEPLLMEQAVLWGLPRAVFDDMSSTVASDVFALSQESVTLRQDPTEFTKLSIAGQRHDSRGSLSAINAPTLVVAGREDILTPYHLAEELFRLIPGAELATVAGAGHAVYEQMPKKFAALVEDFWGRFD